MAKGKLIVIEGSDGSGKETQTRLLLDRLRALNMNVLSRSFPCYGKPSAKPVERYLAGELGNDPAAVNAYAASLFYAMDRYESYLTDWREFYQSGGIVLCDRYTTSNAVFQASKLPRSQVPAFLDWLYDLEYARLGIPKPDAVIYLHAEPSVVWRALSERTGKSGVQHDIHEKKQGFSNHSQRQRTLCRRTQRLDRRPRHAGWRVPQPRGYPRRNIPAFIAPAESRSYRQARTLNRPGLQLRPKGGIPMSDNTNFTIVPPKEQPRSQLYHMSIRFKTDAGIKSLDELTDVCFPGQRVRAADALTLRMAQTVPFVPDEETLAKYAAAIEESYQTSKDAVISNVRFDGYDFIYAVTPAKSTQTKEKLK